MPRKQDIKDLDRIAKRFEMEVEMRKEFGDYLERRKRQGEGGTKNSRQDFTWSELKEKAKEFLGEQATAGDNHVSEG